MNEIKTPARRTFFTRILGGVATLGLAGLVTPALAERIIAPEEGDMNWPGELSGRHRMLIDILSPTGGDGFIFTHHFLRETRNASAVIILRGKAVPLTLNHRMWVKYKLGELYNIIDPETKAPAVKNPYYEVKPGVLKNDEAAMELLMAAGVVFGVCRLGLRAMSRDVAIKVGQKPRDVMGEFLAYAVPGITALPSGPWGVNRAQEAGCTYCFGGGVS